MKKYDEMADNVLRRIDEYNISKQRKRKKIMQVTIPSICLFLTVLIGAGVWKGEYFTQSRDNLSDKENQYPYVYSKDEDKSAEKRDGVPVTDPFIYFCSTQSDGNISSDLLLPNQHHDSKIFLKFSNIKGLNVAQTEEIIDLHENEIRTILSQYKASADSCHYGLSTLKDEGYIVSRMSLNYFTIKLDNIEDIKQIKISNSSSYGQIDVFGTKEISSDYRFPHGKSITIEKDRITEDLAFSWNYSNIDNYFKEHTTPSYEDFNDSFHFIIEYNDGIIKSADIDITFSESGEATVDCGGYKTIAT